MRKVRSFLTCCAERALLDMPPSWGQETPRAARWENLRDIASVKLESEEEAPADDAHRSVWYWDALCVAWAPEKL